MNNNHYIQFLLSQFSMLSCIHIMQSRSFWSPEWGCRLLQAADPVSFFDLFLPSLPPAYFSVGRNESLCGCGSWHENIPPFFYATPTQQSSYGTSYTQVPSHQTLKRQGAWKNLFRLEVLCCCNLSFSPAHVDVKAVQGLYRDTKENSGAKCGHRRRSVAIQKSPNI